MTGGGGAEINFGGHEKFIYLELEGDTGAQEVYSSMDQKKRSSVQNFYEIRCESTNTTKKQFLLANSRAVNTKLGVLGIDSHSSSPKPVNFFGAQSSLGGAQFSFGGHKQSFERAWPRNAPPPPVRRT